MPFERFIPFRKRDMIAVCEALISQQTTLFRTFASLLVNRIHYEYHQQLEELKDSYSHFDPNKDTRDLSYSSHSEKKENQQTFSKGFARLLDAANFEQVTDEDLEAALNEESLGKRIKWLILPLHESETDRHLIGLSG